MRGNDGTPREVPFPGSTEAVDLGCRCAPERNNNGELPPFPPGTHIGGSVGGWYIAAECTLHMTSACRGVLIGYTNWGEPSVEAGMSRPRDDSDR